MHCVEIDHRVENARSMIIGPALNFNFHSSEICPSKIRVHILFAVKGVLPKDWEPMLVIDTFKNFLQESHRAPKNPGPLWRCENPVRKDFVRDIGVSLINDNVLRRIPIDVRAIIQKVTSIS